MSRLSVVHSGKNDPGAFCRREIHFDARHQEQSVGGGDVVGVEQTVTQTRQHPLTPATAQGSPTVPSSEYTHAHDMKEEHEGRTESAKING